LISYVDRHHYFCFIFHLNYGHFPNIQASGLPDVLALLLSVVESLPNSDGNLVPSGLPVGDKYAAVLIDCLTSSKSETRSAALSLVEASLENGLIGFENIKKSTERLKPALQRSVGPMIAKMFQKRQVVKEPEESVSSKLKMEVPQNALKSRLMIKEQTDFNSNHSSGIPCSSDDLSPSKSVPSLPLHPLIPDSGKHGAGMIRSIIWTEYPEEPHGSVLENLKRSWAPLLPPSTVNALFPTSGIRKQDDSKPGLEAISLALSMDKTGGGTTFMDQLDVILKWLMFALCSKESTTGLVDILAICKDIFGFLLESRRELSDSEALETVPLIFDKASGAKVWPVIGLFVIYIYIS
jgi:hypothetical protein